MIVPRHYTIEIIKNKFIGKSIHIRLHADRKLAPLWRQIHKGSNTVIEFLFTRMWVSRISVGVFQKALASDVKGLVFPLPVAITHAHTYTHIHTGKQHLQNKINQIPCSQIRLHQ